MTKRELELIKECLEALKRKCKTEGLYVHTEIAIDIVNKELKIYE